MIEANDDMDWRQSLLLVVGSFLQRQLLILRGGGKSPVKESPYKKLDSCRNFLCFASVQDGAA
jgi:hypothetical protein